MFGILRYVADQSIIGSAQKFLDEQLQPESTVYQNVMHNNGADGAPFIKPQRGHEDGCLGGEC